ncbi:MAG: hypothetical protein ISR73_09345 [Gammaproteobacteria bacterium]|nr:hypothetical protein [Gammaproteobacteria bacterium]
MNDESKIPLLNDLLYRGHLDKPAEKEAPSRDADSDLVIEQEEPAHEQPCIINEEEIRMILVKHMDHAYTEIIQLLHKKTD